MNKKTAREEIRLLVERHHKIAQEGRNIKSKEEEMTKKDLILPLFRALGWDTENKETPDEVTAEEKVSKGWVDYGFRLNSVPKLFVEAKAFSENLDNQKFFEQAVNYAYYKGCPWVVLTNFKTTKILNAEWKTANYYQSHLMTIESEEFLDKFDDLWLLSKESFQKGQLDKLAEKYGKKTKKTTVDQQLLADFTKFRDSLSKDILRLNRAKKLTREELDESVQRILDRLIFIRNCEDRGLEEKKLWEARNEARVWKKVKDVFSYYDRHYDSKLFTYDLTDSKKVHLCDTLDISDSVMRGIIECLYRTKDYSVSYDFSIIEADVLGAVYEQYLSHILKKTEKRARLTENRRHKKEHGIYYTPAYIVDYIVRSTLGDLLKDKTAIAEGIRVLDPACGSGSFLTKTFDVLNEYYRNRKDYDQTKLDTTGTGLTYSKKLEILQDNIFGVDLDRQAVEITQLNLLLKIAEKGHRLPLLEKNVKCGNTLIGDENFQWADSFKEVFGKGGFDVIIGNPPYVSWDKIERTERREFESGEFLDVNYACRPHHKDSQPNYYLFFIVRAANLLNENGVLSFILPQEWLFHNYAKDFRNYMLKRFGEIQILQFNPDFRVFRGPSETVGTNSLILTLRKGNRGINHIYIDETDDGEVREILVRRAFNRKMTKSRDEAYDGLWTFTEPRFDSIRAKINNLEDIVDFDDTDYFEVKGGFQPPLDKATLYEIDENEYAKLTTREKSMVFPLAYDANEIRRYCISKDKRYWIVANDISSEEDLKIQFPNLHRLLSRRLDTKEQLWWHFPNIRNFELIKEYNVKILSPRTAGEPSFALDQDKTVFKGTNTMIVSKKISPAYVLAVLNSRLSDFWYTHFGYEYHSGETKKYEPDKAKTYLIPIRIPSDAQREQLEKLVEKMNRLEKRLNELGDKRTDERTRLEEEARKTDLEIDKIVYRVYEMTETEKEIIETSVGER